MESGVDFVACDNPHATPLLIHILASVAEHEATAISQRTIDALGVVKRALAADGPWVSRRSGRVMTRLGNPNLRPGSRAALRIARQARTARGIETPAGGWNANQVRRVLKRVNKNLRAGADAIAD